MSNLDNPEVLNMATEAFIDEFGRQPHTQLELEKWHESVNGYKYIFTIWPDQDPSDTMTFESFDEQEDWLGIAQASSQWDHIEGFNAVRDLNVKVESQLAWA